LPFGDVHHHLDAREARRLGRHLVVPRVHRTIDAEERGVHRHLVDEHDEPRDVLRRHLQADMRDARLDLLKLGSALLLRLHEGGW
jgi:hypothetical protein